jgi:phosphoribosyl 1,2-cyclic phosphate phosphodiesterase
VLVEVMGKTIVIDTSPDFRYQMLRNQVKKLDAVLLTHEHNDHTIGLDDIRPFNFRQQYEMPVFGLPRVLEDIRSRFRYIFDEHKYPGCPSVVCHEVHPGEPFTILDGLECLPLEVMHGNLPILGYRIGSFAYITDASYISESVLDQLHGLEVLVLNALQFRKHYSHFTLQEALEMAVRIKAKKTYLTHISHNLGKYRDLLTLLPPQVMPAYDGLTISIRFSTEVSGQLLKS